MQRGQGSGFLSEGSSWHTACMSESEGSGETARMRRLAWTFAARIGDKYQIRLTRSIWCRVDHFQPQKEKMYETWTDPTIKSKQKSYDVLRR